MGICNLLLLLLRDDEWVLSQDWFRVCRVVLLDLGWLGLWLLGVCRLMRCWVGGVAF